MQKSSAQEKSMEKKKVCEYTLVSENTFSQSLLIIIAHHCRLHQIR